MITAASTLVGVISDVIWPHLAMITAAVIAAAVQLYNDSAEDRLADRSMTMGRQPGDVWHEIKVHVLPFRALQ